MKKEILQAEYFEIIQENGGLDNLTVFGVYTFLKGEYHPAGFISSHDDLYTEWGRQEDTEPLVAAHIKDDVERYYKFIQTP